MKNIPFLVLLSLILSTESCTIYRPLPADLKHDEFVLINKTDLIYYAKFEVTNKQYRDLLNDISKDLELYNKCKVRTEFWTKYESEFNYTQPFERNYFSHGSFDEYPVVNITPEGAKEYCNWLNRKLSKRQENIYFRLPSTEEFNRLLNTVSIKYDTDTIEDYEEFNLNLGFEGNYPVDGGIYPVIANNKSNYLGNTRKQYVQNELGVQHIVGNVSEILDNDNYTGGSWDSLPSEVTLERAFEKPDPRVGFRIVMVKK